MTEKEFVLKVKESYGGNSKDILLALDFAKQIYKNEKSCFMGSFFLLFDFNTLCML